MTYYRVCN